MHHKTWRVQKCSLTGLSMYIFEFFSSNKEIERCKAWIKSTILQKANFLPGLELQQKIVMRLYFEFVLAVSCWWEKEGNSSPIGECFCYDIFYFLCLVSCDVFASNDWSFETHVSTFSTSSERKQFKRIDICHSL